MPFRISWGASSSRSGSMFGMKSLWTAPVGGASRTYGNTSQSHPIPAHTFSGLSDGEFETTLRPMLIKEKNVSFQEECNKVLRE